MSAPVPKPAPSATMIWACVALFLGFFLFLGWISYLLLTPFGCS